MNPNMLKPLLTQYFHENKNTGLLLMTYLSITGHINNVVLYVKGMHVLWKSKMDLRFAVERNKYCGMLNANSSNTSIITLHYQSCNVRPFSPLCPTWSDLTCMKICSPHIWSFPCVFPTGEWRRCRQTRATRPPCKFSSGWLTTKC